LIGAMIWVIGKLRLISLIVSPFQNNIGWISGQSLAQLRKLYLSVVVEWESGETTYIPLDLIANDDPVTCAGNDSNIWE
jgi:hypothetical protein